MKGDSGFTLLELIVAMTLLSLLSVVLYGALSYGVRSWQRSEQLTTQANAVRRVQTLLVHELGAAYPELETGDPTRSQIAFDGSPQSVLFLVADSERPGALDRVAIGLDGDSLVRRASLELAPNGRGKTSTLLGGLSALDFSYYGPEGDNKEQHWQGTWHERASPPTFVRVRARFASKGSAPFPDLIIAPRIAAEVGCGFDPLTKNCQGR